MSDRIFHREPALTPKETSERFDRQTRIQIEHSASHVVIHREWVRGDAGVESPYGYAERRAEQRQHESKLDLTVPGDLDVVALTNAILAEIVRQRGEQ